MTTATATANLSPDLLVSDVSRAVRFYGDALGLTVIDTVSGPDGLMFAMMGREGFRIMMETAQSPDPTTREMIERAGGTPRATLHLYVSVASIDVEERRLKKAGVSYHGPMTKPYGMKEVAFQDPDGYSWVLGEKVGA
jgi:uncharacterized glyoxalase superfamily protein PhnB